MIIFRADGNKKIGAGHVMRCLSIADAFRDNGEEAAFICAGNDMYDLINSRGYVCEVLGTEYDKLENETELPERSELFKKAKVVIVDSYFVTKKYIEFLNRHVKTVYIDDYVTELPVNVIVNYSIYADKDEYKKVYGDTDTEFVLGTDYVPLRKEFTEGKHIEVKDKAKDVLILSGGSDPLHVSYDIAKEVSSGDVGDLTYHFVIGSLSGDRAEIEKLAAGSENIKIHFDVKDMRALMLSCDMALSAAGSTLYELCSCGIPTINFITADNQKKGADAFTDKNIMMSLGDAGKTDDFAKKAIKAIIDLSLNTDKRKELSLAGKNIINGNGAENLARRLKSVLF